MKNRLIPEVGSWYAHRDKGQIFQVVAVDEDSDCIETQDFDGGVDEFDLDSWFAMPLDPAEAPEDFSGAVDGAGSDDVDYSAAGDWRAPIDDLPGSAQDSAETEDEA